MKVTLQNVEYKGVYYKEVTIDIPQIENLEHADAEWMIRYFVKKELGRR